MTSDTRLQAYQVVERYLRALEDYAGGLQSELDAALSSLEGFEAANAKYWEASSSDPMFDLRDAVRQIGECEFKRSRRAQLLLILGAQHDDLFVGPSAENGVLPLTDADKNFLKKKAGLRKAESLTVEGQNRCRAIARGEFPSFCK